jgi:hypothetical protein
MTQPDDATRLRVDITALRQQVKELDRRVTALHLLTAADDSRHVEQAIIDAASAASNVHKVSSLLGGRGLLEALRDRSARLGALDLTIHEEIDALADEIEATHRRVTRSSLLNQTALVHLARQLGDVLGQPEPQTVYTPPNPSISGQNNSPRLIDRMA